MGRMASDRSTDETPVPPTPTPLQGASEPVRARGLIPRALLDEDAVFVVKRLQQNGHEAYLVGGCVRDLIAGHEPKDFDVATDARPNRIKRLFRSAMVIGRRFRLVHVRFPGNHVVETSTFRGDPARLGIPPEEDDAADEEPREDSLADRFGSENVFGTAPEDARRRDFTVNALFYDPVKDEVIDWVGGLGDLRDRVIRSIGDPSARLREDPVRMIRAVHFAARMGFSIEPALEAAIRDQADLIADASGSRLYVELQKMLARGAARATFRRLYELGVLGAWIPELTEHLDVPMGWPAEAGGTHDEARRGEPEDLPASHATWNLLGAADRWGLATHGVPESLSLAVLVGPWLLDAWHRSGRQGFGPFLDFMEDTFRPVAVRMSVPRWVSGRLKDVLWMLQELRHPPRSGRVRRILFRPVFREALALFEMDLMARDGDPAELEAWRRLAREAGARLEPGGPEPRERVRDDRRPEGAPGRRSRRRRGRRGGRRSSQGAAPEASAWDPPPPEPDAPPRPPPRDAPDSFSEGIG
jgi:poly(A) polymerase